ncbi:MAG: hypothetical protein HY934_02900 [Candidatus Firestonebacteria bacterium]|nr:hypothetical protein [Candidatus Firestonebacteria bacterium]
MNVKTTKRIILSIPFFLLIIILIISYWDNITAKKPKYPDEYGMLR